MPPRSASSATCTVAAPSLEVPGLLGRRRNEAKWPARRIHELKPDTAVRRRESLGLDGGTKRSDVLDPEDSFGLSGGPPQRPFDVHAHRMLGPGGETDDVLAL